MKEEKKESKKVEITRYNPSSRKNEVIELEEIQVGTLRYKDLGDGFECLVGIQTQAVDGDMYTKNHATLGAPRRITSIKWNVSSKTKVGNRVELCPRDVAVLDAILKYLKKMGFQIP